MPGCAASLAASDTFSGEGFLFEVRLVAAEAFMVDDDQSVRADEQVVNKACYLLSLGRDIIKGEFRLLLGRLDVVGCN
jgi:hypothetical protein